MNTRPCARVCGGDEDVRVVNEMKDGGCCAAAGATARARAELVCDWVARVSGFRCGRVSSM